MQIERPPQPISWRVLGFTQKERNAAAESDHWKQLRLRRRKRTKDRCEDCERTGRLELHHLTYERLGAELDEDVRLICQPCHAWRHRAKKHPLLKLAKQAQKKRGKRVKYGGNAERDARRALAKVARQIAEFGRPRKAAF